MYNYGVSINIFWTIEFQFAVTQYLSNECWFSMSWKLWNNNKIYSRKVLVNVIIPFQGFILSQLLLGHYLNIMFHLWTHPWKPSVIYRNSEISPNKILCTAIFHINLTYTYVMIFMTFTWYKSLSFCALRLILWWNDWFEISLAIRSDVIVLYHDTTFL